SDFLNKLDLGLTSLLIAAGIFTLPQAVFVYYRILTLPTFKSQFLMKIFVFNGVMHGLLFYRCSIWSSFLFSFVICVPIIFSGYRYFKIEVGHGVFAYVPGAAEGTAAYYLPSQMHQLGFAIITLIVNILTRIVLKTMRSDYNTSSRARPEQGFLLSSFCSTLVHILNDAVLLLVIYGGLIGVSYSITLFTAISTTLPFWTMIGFAHTMRRAVLSGTPFESTSSIG
ncbi:hypothetical protein PFISCL1PPCAC_5055, partial [Pristionchus fissidentatus]